MTRRNSAHIRFIYKIDYLLMTYMNNNAKNIDEKPTFIQIQTIQTLCRRLAILIEYLAAHHGRR